MNKISKRVRKSLSISMIILMLIGSFIIQPSKTYANSNIDHTNGARAAAVVGLADIAVTVLHNLIRSAWQPSLPNSEPVWRSNENGADVRERLLRYDDRGPEEIFLEGFVPHNAERTVYEYVWDLLDYVAGRTDTDVTPFVSTTRPEIGPNGEIRQWMPDMMFRTRYVYEIFAPGGIDVNASLGSGSPYPEQLEITFPGGIRREFIRSVRVYEGENLDELTEIIMNPYFQGLSDLPNIIIPEGVNVRMWDEKESFSSKEQIKPYEDKAKDPMKVPGHVEKDPYKDDPNNPKRIPDGEYAIKSSINQNVVVDLSKVESYEPVHAFEYLGKLNQKWIFTYNKYYKAYYIKNKQNPELVLDAKSSNDKSDVWVKRAGSLSSLWLPEPTEDGYYKLRNYADPKLVLDLAGGGTSNGNRIQVAENSKDPQYLPNQKWKISPVSYQTIKDGEYTIKSSIDQNVVVDLSKVELHGPVHAYEYLGILNQKWIFTYNKDYKAYHIKNKQNPELVLDAKSSNDKSGVWV
ncbi:RICIN domain-containing protein, partial [Enterococcus mundtii]